MSKKSKRVVPQQAQNASPTLDDNLGGISAEILAQLGDASTVIKLQARDCPVESVTVYADRAEVVRCVSFEAQEGLYDLIIEGVTLQSRDRSIRVQAMDDKRKKKKKRKDVTTPRDNNDGECTIIEVSNELAGSEAAQKSPEWLALAAEKTELTEQRASVEREATVLRAQAKWLDDYAANLVTKEHEPVAFDVAFSFLPQYAENKAKFGTQLAENRKRNDQLLAQVAAVDRKLDEVATLQGDVGTRHRNVTVAVYASRAGTIALRLSYMVSGARWSPSYDCRVLSQEEHVVQMIFYGDVTNSTNEHWENAKISLCTAEPHSGGEPPRMSTLHADFGHSYLPSMSRQSQSFQVQSFSSNCLAPAPASTASSSLAVQHETATVKGSSETTASFVIAGRKTIASDKKSHKLTVSLTTLRNVQFTHTAIARVGKVFLRGTAVNTSGGPWLQGECSVFIEGSFICTNTLKMVMPGEKFNVFLGVDPNVSLKVYPVKEKGRETGMWSKSRVDNKKSRFVVKNHRGDKVVVSLFGQLPLPRNDSIKVKMIEPTSDVVKKEDGHVFLNEFNNLRWTIPLQSGEQKEIVFHYELSYPSDKTISLS